MDYLAFLSLKANKANKAKDSIRGSHKLLSALLLSFIISYAQAYDLGTHGTTFEIKGDFPGSLCRAKIF